MISQFEMLNTQEQALMYEAIPLVTVLIAGADGNMDQQEKEWAEKITKIRSYSYHESLQDYYAKVGENYSTHLDQLMAKFPTDTNQRTAAISAELAKLNDILPKLEHNFARRFYNSLVTFAKHVAKASGGFWGMGSISKAESDLLALDMITPIAPLENEEDEDNQNA